MLLSKVCVLNGNRLSSSMSLCVTNSGKVTVIIRPLGRGGWSSSTILSPGGGALASSDASWRAHTCGGDIRGGTGPRLPERSRILFWDWLYFGHCWNVSPSSSVTTLYIWPISAKIAGNVVNTFLVVLTSSHLTLLACAFTLPWRMALADLTNPPPFVMIVLVSHTYHGLCH
jgi:hypothetical protein